MSCVWLDDVVSLVAEAMLADAPRILANFGAQWEGSNLFFSTFLLTLTRSSTGLAKSTIAQIKASGGYLTSCLPASTAAVHVSLFNW